MRIDFEISLFSAPATYIFSNELLKFGDVLLGKCVREKTRARSVRRTETTE